MSTIQENLEKILHAVFGRDVRQAIHDGIKNCYDDGIAGSEELNEAKRAINILGGELDRVISFNLPDDEGKRELIIINKVNQGNLKYPRSFAKIKERPL